MAYRCSKAAELQDKPMVGNPQCVALVRACTGAPPTLAWRLIQSLGRDKQGNFIRPSNNADAFSVIE